MIYHEIEEWALARHHFERAGRLWDRSIALGLMKPNGFSAVVRKVIAIVKQASTSHRQCKIGIASGFNVRGALETDGPPGATMVARTLEEIFGSQVDTTLVFDFGHLDIARSVADVHGVETATYATPNFLKKKELIGEFDGFDILITIERPGPNRLGVYHNMSGENISFQTEDLVPSALRSRYTLSIGDGGNEFGLGNIEQATRETINFGTMCNCGCKGGIASSFRSSHVILGGCSNFAAYALCGILHWEVTGTSFSREWIERESSALRLMPALGCTDGFSGLPLYGIDGMSLEDYSLYFMKLFDLLEMDC